MSIPTPPQRPALHRPNPQQPDVLAASPQHEATEPDLRRTAGRTTADALRPERKVRLDLRVPKSMRKALRTEAKRRGSSVSDVVVSLLRDRL